jgi:hypothetical protein
MVDIFTRNRCLLPWTKPLSPVSSECDEPIARRKPPQQEGGGGGRIAADESFELQRVGTFEHHAARLRAPACHRTTISQPRQRTILVRFREPAVADHVGGPRPPVAQPDVRTSSLASFETDHLKSLDCRGAKFASHSRKSR